MNKEQILQELTAISRQIAFSLSDCKVEKLIVNDTFDQTYDHFLIDESAKLQTRIIMKKIKVDRDERKD